MQNNFKEKIEVLKEASAILKNTKPIQLEVNGKTVKQNEIKKIIKEIANSFKSEYKIDVEIYAISLFKQLIGRYLNKRYSISCSSTKGLLAQYKSHSAYCDNTENIIVFYLDKGNEMKLLYDSNKDNQFIRIIQLVYHELWHIVQAQKYKNNFLEFIVELEACVKCIKPEHYKRNHDNYFMEIDADYNAIQKTKEYLNRHP